MELLARLEAIEQSDMGLANICEHSLSLIRKALDIYGPEGMAFSFNGGKDSCLALHLMRLAMAQRLMKKYDDDVHMVTEEMFNEEFGKIHMINFFDPDNFEEMDQFIDDQVEKYKLNLRIYKCGFKQGLEKVIEEKGCRAFVLGVRRDDPSGATLEHFYPSSDGWPAFLRVCPILCWKYAEVWRFLRSCELDYCHLYDQGYTSLGSKSTTMPNPLLKQEDGSYSPAYKLEDASSERGGRYVKKTKVCSPSPVKAPVPKSKKAGLIVIGDEILSGLVQDENTSYLTRRLRELGTKVVTCTIIGDDVDTISKAIKKFRKKFDFVFCCGGVGPTHDDVTMEAVCKGFDTEPVENKVMMDFLKSYTGSRFNEHHTKMTMMPENTEVLIEDDGEAEYPTVYVENVYVLPGVPHLCRESFERVSETFRGPKHIVRKLYIRYMEADIANSLEVVQKAFTSRGLTVHSYPVQSSRDKRDYQVVVSLHCHTIQHIEEAAENLKDLLPDDAITKVDCCAALNLSWTGPTLPTCSI